MRREMPVSELLAALPVKTVVGTPPRAVEVIPARLVYQTYTGSSAGSDTAKYQLACVKSAAVA